MGIPGILKEIGKGERTALSKLAIEHFERHHRPLRIAIDAAIWNFQSQSGQGGKNPALRTLFFRLLRLLALPIEPVFVYDGKNKPLTKRGRTVTRYHGTCVPNELSKVLVRKFAYPWHVAPGEAEAECAFLQRKGVVDMVMSQDVDAIMFGAGITLRDWSKEGTRGNKSPTHVNVMDSVKLKEISGLDSDAMILVALLSGGDYDETGVPGFGVSLACEAGRAGFGKDLIELVNSKDWAGLDEWRERLQYELETNESGHFKRRHKALKVPSTFPDLTILDFYTNPAVSREQELPALETKFKDAWSANIDVLALRDYTASMFDWCWKSGARRLMRCLAQPLFQDRLCRGAIDSAAFSVNSVSERRMHFINDGIPELRLSVVPADVAEIDIEAEEDNPEYTVDLPEDEEDGAANLETTTAVDDADGPPTVPSSPSKVRKSMPWNPYTAEKWWIPETLCQLGLPEVVENWHQLQRDIQADPRKFATRKLAKTGKNVGQIDSSMKTGAIRGFFTTIQKQISVTTAISSRENTPFNLENTTAASLNEISSSRSHTNPISATKTDATLRSSTSLLIQNVAQISAESRVKETRSTEDDLKHSACDIYYPQESTNAARRSEHLLQSSSHNVIDPLPDERAHQTQFDQNNSRFPSPHGKIHLGGSSSSAIAIDSSPLSVVSSSTSAMFLRSDEMSKVTQKRPGRKHVRSPKAAAGVKANPHRQLRPIESFFEPFQIQRTDEVSSEPKASASSSGSPTKSQSLNKVAKTGNSAALPRESLPGTWKEPAVGDSHVKRAPRVSYFDMTSD